MTQQPDKRETVARAIYEADRQGGFDAEDPRTFWRSSNSYWSDVVWEAWLEIADAAIAAMRGLDEQAGGK